VAKEKLGTAIFANIIALGTLAALTRVVSRSALIEAVKNRAPRGTLEANLKALELGFDLTKKRTRKTRPKTTR